ncbi:hypothetical protein [Oceanicola sp. 502str15]|uniref:hypothetical protein n=1 Tax=Oceanicola sp. 502str15 TaxID=2696061 RepID=UPI0020964EF9|nr:hypothetical protein [Oceanicola sp. 502str15]MCO6381959.1 hypothetical protein [Oceanicola sp. 502str15]
MDIGVGVGPLRSGRKRFWPGALFEGGALGAWFDAAAAGGLWQDDAGAQPVLAAGQGVGRVRDGTLQGHDALQASAGQRPTLGRTPAGGRRNLLNNSHNSGSWLTLHGGAGKAPLRNHLPALAETPLPDGASGAEASRGFTCTGLTWAEGDLWVGNYGLASPGAPGAAPSLVRLSPDLGAVAAQIPIAANPQGLAFDGTWIYYAGSGANAGAGSIRRVAPDGSGDSHVHSLVDANALAHDAGRNGFWTSQFPGSTITLHSADDWSVITSFDTGVMIDHAALDPATGWLLISSGNNDIEGRIGVYNPHTGSLLKQYVVIGGYAIEGLAVQGGEITAAFDGYYHRSEIANATYHTNRLSRLRIKPRANGLPADLWRLDGGNLGHPNDFSCLQTDTPGASPASVTVSIVAAAYDDSAPVLALRHPSHGYAFPALGPSWQTHALTAAGTPAPAPLQLLARAPVEGGSSSPVVFFWLEGAQYEAGTTATPCQQVNGAFDVTEAGQRSLAYFGHDLADDALSATLPDLGSNATEFWASAAAGVVINTGQTIGAGARTLPQEDRLFAYGVIDRALTGAETSALTAWLETAAGV